MSSRLRNSCGFGWSTDQCANPSEAVFYLDAIAFEYDPNLLPPPPPGPIFPVYTDAAAADNHYTPSGWMGDATIPGHFSLTECWHENPHSGQTSIKITYTQATIGWGGVYWLHSAGNWGQLPGGYDLTGADRLTFWARSDTPGLQVTFLIGGIGYPNGTNCTQPTQPFADSVCPKFEQVETLSLSPTWSQYTIVLPGSPPRVFDKVMGGFGLTVVGQATFYLDDVVYEFDP